MYVVITTKANIGVKFILVLGEIFYKHSVVGGVVYYTVVIYGGGTHSARRYKRDCEVIKLYRCIHAARNGDQFFCG